MNADVHGRGQLNAMLVSCLIAALTCGTWTALSQHKRNSEQHLSISTPQYFLTLRRPGGSNTNTKANPSVVTLKARAEDRGGKSPEQIS